MVFDWQPIFQGIDYAQTYRGVAFPPAEGTREQLVNVLRIDLLNENVHFFSTPKNKESIFDTIGMRITDFLTAHPEVCVAVNANFCWADFSQGKPDQPCTEIHDGCKNFQTPGLPYKLIGLAISEGELVSEPTQSANDAGAVAVAISYANQVSFVSAMTEDAQIPTDIRTAVAGGPNPTKLSPPPVQRNSGPLFLIESQKKTKNNDCDTVAARTAIGVSDDQHYFYLLTIDGIEGSQPPQGAAFNDVAEWLLLAGASTGFALDGGGSTVMARSYPSGPPGLLNAPHGCETEDIVCRYLGNYLGVVSKPLS